MDSNIKVRDSKHINNGISIEMTTNQTNRFLKIKLRFEVYS